MQISPTSSNPTAKACVMMIRADFGFCSDRRILATTEAPMPNINPMPVAIMKNRSHDINRCDTVGTNALTDENSVDDRQSRIENHSDERRKNKARNKGPILPSAKSSLSLSRFLLRITSTVFLNYGCKFRDFRLK